MSNPKRSWALRQLLKLKTFFFTKDVLSFLLFLALSTSFWFVHTLGRERQNVIKVNINYTGIPNDIEITNKVPKTIEVTIRDDGYKLLQYSNKKLDPINIDLTRVFFSKGKIVITPDQIKNKLSNYFLPTTAVKGINPDSLVVEYQKLETKELPIKIAGIVEPAKQYIFSDTIYIEPSKVKVYGPKHVLDSMKAVYTDKLDLENITDTTQVQTKLKKTAGVRYSFSDVSIGIFVEMFTENHLDIPIAIINAPANMNVRIFPVSVKATFNVGLSNFEKIKASDIKVVFDYNDVVDKQNRKYRLKIISTTPYVSNLHIDPEEVEFILEKK